MFDTDFYLNKYKGARRAAQNPLIHYLTIGAARGFDPHSQFETDGYKHMYPDVVGINPLTHYVLHGKTEKRLSSMMHRHLLTPFVPAAITPLEVSPTFSFVASVYNKENELRYFLDALARLLRALGVPRDETRDIAERALADAGVPRD